MIDGLLRQAGSVGFARHLFAVAREHAGVDQLVIYEYIRGTPATVLAQEDLHGDMAQAARNRKLAESAFVGHCAYDEPAPSHRQLRLHVLDVMGAGVDGEESVEAAAPQLIRSTMALVLRDPDKDPDKHLVIHFARYHPSDSFTDEQRRFIMDHAATIALAVERHCDGLRSPGFPLVRAWARYLEEVPGLPLLSAQEALVCAYGLLGWAKSDIASRMKISVHSVTAYRRRAYAKLNITSQIELASLLVFSPPAKAVHGEPSPERGSLETMA